ncbi:hypothetical protein [Spiroplasma endosymbiont of Amphibalanus improvisus]|uniref:hypothetical protein n=1 Tax=Spiroplasma endosymbiont of Amphibalanus improvisus TaxID=3066327 RepID=UPI00313B132B
MKSLGSIKIDVTWVKIFGWVASLWLFIGIILALTIKGVSYECFNNDGGAIIFLATWLLAVLTMFANTKKTKLFIGLLFFILGILIFIGSLITDSSASTIFIWSIPAVIIVVISIIWFVDVMKHSNAKVIKVK